MYLILFYCVFLNNTFKYKDFYDLLDSYSNKKSNQIIIIIIIIIIIKII